MCADFHTVADNTVCKNVVILIFCVLTFRISSFILILRIHFDLGLITVVLKMALD